MFNLRKHKAQSTVEYMAVVVILLLAFLLLQKYIVRGFVGRWKSSGDTFGYGRVYDPNKTVECAYDYQFFNAWYNQVCYENKCDCLSAASTDTTCKDCISGCRTSFCEEPIPDDGEDGGGGGGEEEDDERFPPIIEQN